MDTKYKTRINHPRSSGYRKEKFLSLAITLVITGILLFSLSQMKITFPPPNEKYDAEMVHDADFNSHFDLENYTDHYISESDSIVNDSIANPTQDSLKKDIPVVPSDNKIITANVVKEKAKENLKEKSKKNISEKQNNISKNDNNLKKSKSRRLISSIPGTLGAKGKLPINNCKGKGSITYFYTVDKNGSVIKVWKKSGNVNSCLEKTGAEWIKKYVKIDKGADNWTGTYNLKFK